MAVYEVFSDPDVARHTYLMDSAQSRKWVAGKLKNQSRTPRLAQGKAIVLQEQELLIGWIEMSPPQFIGRPVVPGELALSYALHRSFWGNGYMTEALRKMMDFAFESLHAPQLVATCEVLNTASARVMERAGMVRVETYLHLERGFMEVPHHRYEMDKSRYEAEVRHDSSLN